MSDIITENRENTDNPAPAQTDEQNGSTTKSSSDEQTLQDVIAALTDENKRILTELKEVRTLYEQSFNRQPPTLSEHDEFDEVCRKILKGER